MIQSILLFALGFLCAAFLALMIAPALWRRAVALTRKRIEASVPLTLTEIQADKDRLRAEFAMSTRRLEMSVKQFRDKASGQIIEINRNRQELRQLAGERDEKNHSLSQIESKSAELRGELRQREDQLDRMGERLADTERALERKALELDKLSRMYDEASFSSSSRQIELVARESEVEKLTGDMSTLSGERKDFERRYKDLGDENRTTRDALKSEKKKSADLERKIERMLTGMTERDEKLEKRERELARLRERLKDEAAAEDEVSAQLVEAQTEKLRLESEIAELNLRMTTILESARAEDIEKAVEGLKADRERVEGEIAAQKAENAKLKAEIAAHERARSEDWSDERRGSAILREQMNDLAAEVLNLTAMLDGPNSPIEKALAAPPAFPAPVNDAGDKIASLADRVKALKQAASGG